MCLMVLLIMLFSLLAERDLKWKNHGQTSWQSCISLLITHEDGTEFIFEYVEM